MKCIVVGHNAWARVSEDVSPEVIEVIKEIVRIANATDLTSLDQQGEQKPDNHVIDPKET